MSERENGSERLRKATQELVGIAEAATAQVAGSGAITIRELRTAAGNVRKAWGEVENSFAPSSNIGTTARAMRKAAQRTLEYANALDRFNDALEEKGLPGE